MQERTFEVARLVGLFALVGLAGSAGSCATAAEEAVEAAAAASIEDEHQEDEAEARAAVWGATIGPGNLHAYSMQIFRVYYYHGGYNLPIASYEEGEYTRWKTTGGGRGDVVERTLFERRDDGSEWWRLETIYSDDGDDEKDRYIQEVLLAPEEDGDRDILRMRVKYPDEEEPSEVPVTEEESKEWAVSSQQELTEESFNGMHVGAETIETPAGSFQTDRYRASHYQGSGDVNWWLAAGEVPGDVVQYNQVDDDDTRYSVVLVDYGSDATESKLGVLEGGDEGDQE